MIELFVEQLIIADRSNPSQNNQTADGTRTDSLEIRALPSEWYSAREAIAQVSRLYGFQQVTGEVIVSGPAAASRKICVCARMKSAIL